MKTNSRAALSSIEPLESRIAPAGLVGAVLSPTGQLTLSTVDPDVSVQLEELTGGEWVLTGYAGTTVQLNGGPAQAEVFFKGFKGEFDALFASGNNLLTFHDAAVPKSVVINCGVGGSTQLVVDDSKVAGSFTVNGDSGFEEISFFGFKDSVGHDVVLAGKAGGTEVRSLASYLTIGGKLS